MRAAETILGPAAHFPVRITLANGERHVVISPVDVCIHPYTLKFIFTPDNSNEFSRAISQAEIVAVEPLGRPIGRALLGEWLVAE